MTLLTPELAERLAGYVVNRRDKRLITFSVLALYAAALLYHLVAPAAGVPTARAALDSIEALALVVVVAHIAGSVAVRGFAARAVAVRGFGERERAPRAADRRRAASPASNAADVAAGTAAGGAP